MMSSRIFESSAAGAVIICNENPFARRHFGDSLLYIDTTLPRKKHTTRFDRIWPGSSLNLPKRWSWLNVRRAYSVELQAGHLSGTHLCWAARPADTLARAYMPHRPEEKICVVFLMPEFHAEVLEQHIASCQAQKNVAIRGIVAMDAKDAELFGTRVQCRLSTAQIPLEIAAVHFTERRPDGR